MTAAEIIANHMSRWLTRYVPPTHLRADAGARQDEIDAIVGALMRYAPKTDVERWIDRITERLDHAMQTRAWPAVREVVDACMAIRREDQQAASAAPREQGEAPSFDVFQATANAIHAGRAVGESYLWGRNAVVLLRRKLVTRAEIDALRRAAYYGHLTTHGEDAAEAWLELAEEQHAYGIAAEDAASRKRLDVARGRVELPAMRRIPSVTA